MWVGVPVLDIGQCGHHHLCKSHLSPDLTSGVGLGLWGQRLNLRKLLCVSSWDSPQAGSILYEGAPRSARCDRKEDRDHFEGGHPHMSPQSVRGLAFIARVGERSTWSLASCCWRAPSRLTPSLEPG